MSRQSSSTPVYHLNQLLLASTSTATATFPSSPPMAQTQGPPPFPPPFIPRHHRRLLPPALHLQPIHHPAAAHHAGHIILPYPANPPSHSSSAPISLASVAMASTGRRAGSPSRKPALPIHALLIADPQSPEKKTPSESSLRPPHSAPIRYADAGVSDRRASLQSDRGLVSAKDVTLPHQYRPHLPHLPQAPRPPPPPPPRRTLSFPTGLEAREAASYGPSSSPYRPSQISSHKTQANSVDLGRPIRYSPQASGSSFDAGVAASASELALEDSDLADNKKDFIYQLRIRQQPAAARACGFGERDRRVIDPPPILQLLVTNKTTGTTDVDELHYPLNVVHCSLWNAEGTHEETAVSQPDRVSTRRLMGQLVASPTVARDEFDNEGCFFCFHDLSCRTYGKYRLRFVLMRIDLGNLSVGGFNPILTDILSDVFTVYTAKDFPGMQPSSALTRSLKLQGCNIQVKKGNDKAKQPKRDLSSEQEEVNETASTSSKGKRRRK